MCVCIWHFVLFATPPPDPLADTQLQLLIDAAVAAEMRRCHTLPCCHISRWCCGRVNSF